MLTVLDTNIWLDWLLFDDPSIAPLAAWHAQARIDIVYSAVTAGEFTAVIARSRFDRLAERRAEALACFGRIGRLFDAPIRASPLCCSDPKDQPFLDLATSCRAGLLLTKDKALLKLARRARVQHHLTIATVTRWAVDASVRPPA